MEKRIQPESKYEMIVMDFPNAVSNQSAFYNRRIEFDKAVQTILSGKRIPLVIIGERRIGKTSLQNVVVEEVRNKSLTHVALYVEPRSISSVDLFVEAILRQLTKHLKCDIRASGLCDSQGHIHLEAPDQFDLAIQQLLPKDIAEEYILCIDEFDEIIRLVTKAGEEEKERLFALIHHLTERNPLPISLFFTITRIPDPMKVEFPSALITKSEIVELLPFDESISQGMIDWLLSGQNISIHPTVKERIIDLSGGHPYFIKLLISNLTGMEQNLGDIVIDLSKFEDVVLPRALEDPRARYAIENIYKAQHFSSSEKSVLLYLAERGEPVDASEFNFGGRDIVNAARNLVNRHYLIKQSEKYSSQIHFLDYWFRNWGEFEEELERLNVHHIVGHE